MRPRTLLLVLLLALAVTLTSCAPFRPPVKEALERVPAKRAGRLADDLGAASLKRSLEQSLAYLSRLPPERRFSFGPDSTTTSGMIFSLTEVLRLLEKHGLGDAFFEALAKDFYFYRPPGEVLFTGYYEPLLEGRRRPEGRYTCPLLARPPDLIWLDLKDFGLESKILRGRVEDNRMIPYRTRQEISQGALGGQGLELAWVDPVEAFFLHIQGSGQIRFPDGEVMRVNYASQNGRSYVSLGKVMIERGLLAREEVSLESLKKYLHEHPDEAEELMDTNPSYVFFRVLEDGPMGCLDVPLTPGRSLALDRRLYPKAALAFIRTRLPIVEGDRISGWRAASRLILVQDTGGAIRGYHRADLFFGAGAEAELSAGHLKEPGQLFLLLHKDAVKD